MFKYFTHKKGWFITSPLSLYVYATILALAHIVRFIKQDIQSTFPINANDLTKAAARLGSLIMVA